MDIKLNFIESENNELLKLIEIASKSGDETGKIFSKVYSIFKPHLKMEAKTVVPLIEYLSDRLLSRSLIDKSGLMETRDTFDSEYDHLLQEHSEINSLLIGILAAGSVKVSSGAEALAKRLATRIELEEQILYPAAFASGDLIEWERELLGQKLRY